MFRAYRLKRDAIMAAIITCHIVVGQLYFANGDHGWGDETSAYLNALYFTVVTMSTVGYGDLTIHSNGDRWLASAFILISISVIINLVGTLYDEACQLIAFTFRWTAYRLFSIPMPRKKQQSWSAHVQPAWRFYIEELGGYVVFGLLLNIALAAYFYTLAEDITYSDSLWHCWCTATTVSHAVL